MKNLVLAILFVVPFTLCGSNLMESLNKPKDKTVNNLSLYVDGGTFGIGYRRISHILFDKGYRSVRTKRLF